MTRAPLAHLVAAATLVVAATCVLGPTPAPASAASCGSGSGVTVVVDPGALGGALTSVCDSGDGQVSSERYADVGVAIAYVQRQPGFVCRVNDTPATEPCVNTPPTDAYWGLFWTDGKSGTWAYSSIGVTGLQVPEGGAVALVWQQGSARRVPGTAAPVHASPTPTPTPTRSPTKTTSPTPSATAPVTPSSTLSASSASPSASPPSSAPDATTSPSSKPSTQSPASRPTKKASRAPTTRPDAADTESTDGSGGPTPAAAPTAAESDSGRVPTWLTLTILVLLLIAIGISALAARRRTHH